MHSWYEVPFVINLACPYSRELISIFFIPKIFIIIFVFITYYVITVFVRSSLIPALNTFVNQTNAFFKHLYSFALTVNSICIVILFFIIASENNHSKCYPFVDRGRISTSIVVLWMDCISISTSTTRAVVVIFTISKSANNYFFITSLVDVNVY